MSGKPAHHGWDHRPGGEDAIPGVGDLMYPTAFNLSPMLFDMYADALPGGVPPSGFVIDPTCVHNGYFQMSGVGKAFYYRVRLGPKGSIWYTNPLFCSKSDGAVITVDFATDTENAIGGSYADPTGLMGEDETLLVYPRDTSNGGFDFNLNTYDSNSAVTTPNRVSGLGNLWRMTGDPGAPHTAWTYDAGDGWWTSDGGPGLWCVRVQIEDRTDPHLSFIAGANTLRLINLPLVRLSGREVM